MVDPKKIDWHTLSKEETLLILQTRINGLTDPEVKKRFSIYGHNEIVEEKQRSPAIIFAKQFKEPLIIILLVATTISAFVGELIDAIVIIAIVILAAIVGFVQEYRSKKAIEALKKMAATTVRVIRDDEEKIIDTRELVPGDVIVLSVGDRVPADAYIMEAFNLEVDEAPLTGESVPVQKNIGQLAKETAVADRKNILHMITTVTYGHAKALVFATGMSTELGKIATAVQRIELQKTPFEVRMRHIGKLLSMIMLAVVGAISILGFLRGHQVLEMLILGISLAVAAVPEALPAVIAASLTVGLYRMAKQNAIVRRLPAVETLGSTTVICSDKTGTLTKGEMTVRKVYVYDKFADVTGAGYSYEGNVVDSIDKDDLTLLARAGILCNDSYVKATEGRISVIGDPTEAALVVFARKVGMTKEGVDAELPRIQEVSFTSERKRMTTIHKIDDKFQAFMKGAVEVVLSRCNSMIANGKSLLLDENIRARILSGNNEMAAQGLRVLAIAYKQLDSNNFAENYVESNVTFIGLVGIMDPPRTEVVNAVAECRSAGIDVIMITGDHKLTARAVAEEIGISEIATKVMSGTELDTIDVSALAEEVAQTKVYARVSPEHKIKIVRALKKRGHIVAMTGDGINDAPALKAADIGVAMGITGTQVTKEAASMILVDDNFTSIVSAVKEGRRILDNVKKYLVYLLSVNIGEMIILAFSVIMGWPFPLLAKHILYINLATDGSPAIALGLEPHEPDIMKRKPRDPKESVFFGVKKWLIGISILLAVVSLSLFWYVMEVHGWESEFAIMKARTMMFGLIVFFELFFALSCRSFKHNIRTLGLLGNRLLIYSLIGESTAMLFIMNHPAMQDIFDLTPLEPMDWAFMLMLATTGFACSEIVKFLTKRKNINKNKH